MSLFARFRAWRLERAELELADARHYKAKWVDGWNASPSRKRGAEKRIDRAERKVAKLHGKDVPESEDS